MENLRHTCPFKVRGAIVQGEGGLKMLHQDCLSLQLQLLTKDPDQDLLCHFFVLSYQTSHYYFTSQNSRNFSALFSKTCHS